MDELYERLIELTPQHLAGERPTVRDWNKAMGVARAVLELHKPEFFGGHIACLACSPGMPPPVLVMWSDCETVKAIAEALGVTG